MPSAFGLDPSEVSSQNSCKRRGPGQFGRAVEVWTSDHESGDLAGHLRVVWALGFTLPRRQAGACRLPSSAHTWEHGPAFQTSSGHWQGVAIKESHSPAWSLGATLTAFICATLQLCTAYRWQDSRSAELRLAEVLTSGMGGNEYVYMAWSEATNLRCCSATAVLGFKFETSGLGSVGVQGLGDSRLILRHLTPNPWKCLGFRLRV